MLSFFHVTQCMNPLSIVHWVFICAPELYFTSLFTALSSCLPVRCTKHKKASRLTTHTVSISCVRTKCRTQKKCKYNASTMEQRHTMAPANVGKTKPARKREATIEAHDEKKTKVQVPKRTHRLNEGQPVYQCHIKSPSRDLYRPIRAQSKTPIFTFQSFASSTTWYDAFTCSKENPTARSRHTHYKSFITVQKQLIHRKVLQASSNQNTSNFCNLRLSGLNK